MPYIPYTQERCPFRNIRITGSGVSAICESEDSGCYGGHCPEGAFPEGCPYRDVKAVGKGFRHVTEYGEPR